MTPHPELPPSPADPDPDLDLDLDSFVGIVEALDTSGTDRWFSDADRLNQLHFAYLDVHLGALARAHGITGADPLVEAYNTLTQALDNLHATQAARIAAVAPQAGIHLPSSAGSGDRVSKASFFSPSPPSSEDSCDTVSAFAGHAGPAELDSAASAAPATAAQAALMARAGPASPDSPTMLTMPTAPTTPTPTTPTTPTAQPQIPVAGRFGSLVIRQNQLMGIRAASALLASHRQGLCGMDESCHKDWGIIQSSLQGAVDSLTAAEAALSIGVKQLLVHNVVAVANSQTKNFMNLLRDPDPESAPSTPRLVDGAPNGSAVVHKGEGVVSIPDPEARLSSPGAAERGGAHDRARVSGHASPVLSPLMDLEAKEDPLTPDAPPSEFPERAFEEWKENDAPRSLPCSPLSQTARLASPLQVGHPGPSSSGLPSPSSKRAGAAALVSAARDDTPVARADCPALLSGLFESPTCPGNSSPQPPTFAECNVPAARMRRRWSIGTPSENLQPFTARRTSDPDSRPEFRCFDFAPSAGAAGAGATADGSPTLSSTELRGTDCAPSRHRRLHSVSESSSDTTLIDSPGSELPEGAFAKGPIRLRRKRRSTGSRLSISSAPTTPGAPDAPGGFAGSRRTSLTAVSVPKAPPSPLWESAVLPFAVQFAAVIALVLMLELLRVRVLGETPISTLVT